ncbi:MAG: hypothetical protein CSYNP_02360 [Syntrophus sp. SKADARSKE-3]|nr:hypothetical protein [Syntrophus sp. SKADARSKE-3]
MADKVEQKFSFVSDALPKETFGVVSFQGSEGISQPYAFEILLIADDLEIDLDKVLQNRARLIIHRPGQPDVLYNGILATFEQQREVDKKALYRAYMVPKLWWLSITQHNQIFLDKTVQEMVDLCLKDGGMTAEDYEFRLQGSYSPIEYVCQYGESHLNFVSRWLEREGIYYYFDQTASGEKIIFTDTHIAHSDLPMGKTLYYSPPSGLEAGHRSETIQTLTCSRRLTPASVFLKDYNYRKPSLDLSGSAVVAENGRGQVYTYNEHFRTAEDGNRLAKIRAEALSCRQEQYPGESSVPFMLPGFTFDLQNHYRGSYNQKYLIVEVQHEGNQPSVMLSGFQAGSGRGDSPPAYSNTFNAIKASAQFRPEQKAVKPKISGTIIAKIDASGSGQTAELDSQGRYKVILPFDLSGRKDGKASAWVRMAQPYAGSDHGMHFPLHKGTDVMLTFIDGDPDRPIIASAVPNPETPSPVTSDNQTQSVIQTAGQNKIAIEDQDGSERILMHTPKKDSFVRIGAPNDPPPPEGWSYVKPDNPMTPSKDGVTISTGSFYDVKAQWTNTFVLGSSATYIAGANTSIIGGVDTKFVLGYRFDTTIGARSDFHVGPRNRGNSIAVHLSATYTKIDGDKLETAISHSKAITNVNKALGTKLEASDLVTQLVNQKQQITAGYTEAIGERTAALATKAEVAAAKQQAVAESTEVTAAQVHTVAEKVETVAQKTATLASKVETLGSAVKTAASVVVNAASENRVTLNSNELAALKTIT